MKDNKVLPSTTIPVSPELYEILKGLVKVRDTLNEYAENHEKVIKYSFNKDIDEITEPLHSLMYDVGEAISFELLENVG